MIPEKKQSPEEQKKVKFFQFLQEDIDEKIKILTESVADLQEKDKLNKAQIEELNKENTYMWSRFIQRKYGFDKQLAKIYRLMWLFIIIIFILSATNIFLFRN